MKKSRITTALLAIGISASMVFQTPVFATEETAVAVSSGVTTNGISGWPQGPEITSASAVIMEDTSDTILYAKDMDTTLSPAGAVKIMTCLLALENSQLDDQVTMTETGVSGVTDGGAHISSQLGEVFTMEQCLYALMLASANDIALQVAEQIGGSVDAFVQKMNDRAKELTVVLTQQDMPEQGMTTIPGLQYYCMTPYDASFKGVHILFPKENVQDTLGEYLSKKGLKQLHTAETEKYAHVTFFFNGGRETPFEGEDRILVPSPKVATYDLKPEMSAYEVKDKLVTAIKEDKYDFIVVNFANGDMVGHTGIYAAIEKAVKAVDECVKEVVETAKAMNDYEVIIIADHGNADNAVNPDGTPNTAHSLNPVPFIYVTANKEAKVENGILADVAPSILHIMGLEQPADMTGKNLIKD